MKIRYIKIIIVKYNSNNKNNSNNNNNNKIIAIGKTIINLSLKLKK